MLQCRARHAKRGRVAGRYAQQAAATCPAQILCCAASPPRPVHLGKKLGEGVRCAHAVSGAHDAGH